VESRNAILAVGLAAALVSPQSSKPAAAPAGAGAVNFGSEPLKIGTKLTVTSEQVFNSIECRMGVEVISMAMNTYKAAFAATVTQADASAYRMKFEFGKCARSSDPPFKNAPAELDVSNKTYEVTHQDGREQVVGSDGAGLPPSILTSLQHYTSPLVSELPLVRVLGGRTVQIGTTVEVPEEAAALAFPGLRRLGMGGTTTLTLSEERVVDGQECGIFKIAAKLPQLGNAQFKTRVEIEYTGEVVVTKRHSLVLGATCEGVYVFPDKKGAGSGKKSAKEGKPPPKGALQNETWKYHVKIG
jgi:hypothetical protein